MESQAVANVMWARRRSGGRLGTGAMRCALEGAAVRVAPSMNAQDVANTVWALRVERPVDEWMRQNQNGFRPLKSCRDAVFRLWREPEKAKETKVPTIYTFVDFSKAFDSLVWACMWEIIEFAAVRQRS